MDLKEIMGHKVAMDHNKEDGDLKANHHKVVMDHNKDGDLKANHHKEIILHQDMDQVHNKEDGDLKVVGVQDHNKVVGALNLLLNLKEHLLKKLLNQKLQQS